MNLSPEHRIAGVLCPIFALRTENDLGIGDTGAMREFIDWSAAYGLRLVQLLPINETGPDNSPYNAVSSIALDPVTLEVNPGAVKDLSEADYRASLADVDISALREGAVHYTAVKRLKQDLLGRAFQRFDRLAKAGTARHAALGKFHAEHVGWLEGYALFRALMERHGTEMWDTWPGGVGDMAAAKRWLETLGARERKAFEKRMRYYAWVQMVAFEQWRAVRAHATRRGVALMGDVPIGVSYYSADVFSSPEQFDLRWSGGAPPERIFASDEFTMKWGQNWGIPLYRWDVMEKDGYAWWRRRVSVVREVFDLFRVDHVLGFYRIFSFPWRPQENSAFLPLSEDEARARTGGPLPGFLPRPDDTQEQRQANREGGEKLLRILVEEVGMQRLLGEDLGVVPEYVRPSLLSLGIAGFRIPQWEKNHDQRLVSGEHYDRLSIATYATHDHDPMRVMWERWAETIRGAEAGDASRNDAAGRARWEMQLLIDFAHLERSAGAIPYTAEIREGLLRGLFRSNAWIAVAMVTDFLGQTLRFNVPGAIAETNWSNRLPRTVRELAADPEACGSMERVRALVEETGRMEMR